MSNIDPNKDNQQQVIEIPTGGRYEGMVKDGRPNGQGVFYSSAGSKYEGSFKNGLKDGFGTLYQTDGSQLAGNYMEGILQGPAVYLDKSKSPSYLLCLNGKIIEKALNSDLTGLPNRIGDFIFTRQHEYPSTVGDKGVGYRNFELELSASIFIYNYDNLVFDVMLESEVKHINESLESAHKNYRVISRKKLLILDKEYFEISASIADGVEGSNLETLISITVIGVMRNDFLKLRITFLKDAQFDEKMNQSHLFIEEAIKSISNMPTPAKISFRKAPVGLA